MSNDLNQRIEQCTAHNKELYARLEQITLEKSKNKNAILLADLMREEAALRLEINEGINHFLRLYYQKAFNK